MERTTTRIDRRTLSENKIGIVGAKKKADRDKKNPVQVYVRQWLIDELGGIEAARELAIKALVGHRKNYK